MRTAVVLAAACAAPAAATATALRGAAPASDAGPYVLDTWPVGIKGLNVSQVTAVAVTGLEEVTVAQRGEALPPYLVFDKAQGSLLRTWGTGILASPHGMYQIPSSSLAITDIVNGTVAEFDPVSGILLSRVGTNGVHGNGLNPVQFSAPADVAVSNGGLLLVSDGDGGSNNRVLAMKRGAGAGAVAWSVGGLGTAPGQFNSPHSIAVAAQWNVAVVADRGNTRLQWLNAETGAVVAVWNASQGCFGTAAAVPWGVRVDNARGRLFVADGANGSVYVLQFNASTPGWADGAVPADCQAAAPLLQTLAVPNGATCKPHELAVDQRSGALYVTGVATPPTLVRFTPQE